jgi:tRNA(Ile)-lysidine synthase
MQPLALPQTQAVIWDGRFELAADRPGLTVCGLAGFASRLPRAERTRLSAIPAIARGALPAIVVNGGETVTCPILAEASQVRCRALAAGRLLAACDLIAHEAAANRLAHGEFTFDVLSWARELEKGRSE